MLLLVIAIIPYYQCILVMRNAGNRFLRICKENKKLALPVLIYGRL